MITLAVDGDRPAITGLVLWRTLKGFSLMQDMNQIRATCTLQDITPGIYTIEVNPTVLACFFFFLEYWLDLCRQQQFACLSPT